MVERDDIAILVPAAGASRRMRGMDKLVELVDPPGAETLLRRTALAAVATGARVIVTIPDTGPHAPARRATLTGLPLTVLAVPDAHEGMAASLRAGVKSAGMAAGLMVVLPDMPDIGTEELLQIIGRFRQDERRAVRAATADGTPGHPVIFPRRLFAGLAVLTGDVGGRRLLEGEPVETVRLAGLKAATEINTPEDWAAWQHRI